MVRSREKKIFPDMKKRTAYNNFALGSSHPVTCDKFHRFRVRFGDVEADGYGSRHRCLRRGEAFRACFGRSAKNGPLLEPFSAGPEEAVSGKTGLFHGALCVLSVTAVPLPSVVNGAGGEQSQQSAHRGQGCCRFHFSTSEFRNFRFS